MSERSNNQWRAEWIICRNLDQYPVADDALLYRWAQRGRILPNDYLFNPRLDTCVQAKEIPELHRILCAARMRRLTTVSSLLTWVASVLQRFRERGLSSISRAVKTSKRNRMIPADLPCAATIE